MLITVIIFIITLAVLVLSHEFGHFIVAKKAGIRVDEFGFGFPPRLWSFKKGETIYSINLIPFGGFVKIYGENPDDENTTGTDKARSMVNKPRLTQAAVLVAGVFLNLVLAWFLIATNLSLGMPVATSAVPAGVKTEKTQLLVMSVLKDSPAARAGLSAGDNLISLQAGADILNQPNAETVKKFVVGHQGEDISFSYKRPLSDNPDLISIIKIKPVVSAGHNEPTVGIAMEQVGLVKVSFFRALVLGFSFTYEMIIGTIFGFYYFFSSLFTDGASALSSVAGPIGLFGLVGDTSRLGLVYLLNFIALISVNLAVLNLLPFPALDGGRILFLAIEGIKGSRLNPKIANSLNFIGFILLMILMVIVTISDVGKLF